MTEIIYKCENCNRSFNSKYQLSGHMKVHRDNYDEIQRKSTQNILKSSEKISLRCEQEYYKNPKYCLHCEQMLPYGKEKDAKFCSRSCSASYTNKQRKPRSIESRLKTSNTLKSKYDKVEKKPKRKSYKKNKTITKKTEIKFTPIKSIKNILKRETKIAVKSGIPLSLLKFNTCKHCNKKFMFKISQKYCNDCRSMYSNNQRAKYAFTFNVFNYPDIFDLELISKLGFYTSKDRKKRWNPDGLTRDHKISVTESIKNNYDPYYIKHPLNCELMSFTENNKKKTKCSMLYKDLVRLVDEYENTQLISKLS